MVRPRFIPIRRNSLFVKLLTGFLIVIVLLISFNALSFAFFKNNIEREIIDNSTLNLSNTVDRYEKQFKIVESAVMKFYFNDRFYSILQKDNMLDYYTAHQIITKEISALVSDDLLLLENMLVLFRDNSIVLDKQGLSGTADFFSKSYSSEPYNALFWKQQFTDSYSLSIFPAAAFNEISFDKHVVSKGDLVPFVIKNQFNSRYIVAALLDADRMFQAFGHGGDDSFFILDASQRMLFHSENDRRAPANDSGSRGGLPDRFTASQTTGYMNIDNYYYMYKKGAHSGLTYVYAIPNVRIASQVAHLNMVLIVILAVSLVLSVIISILLSMKLNSPIQRIVQLVERGGHSDKRPSKIHEFDLISDNIADMIRTNQSFHHDIEMKNDLLKNYGYINQIKNIYQWDGLRKLIEMNKPFYLVAFQLAFTKHFRSLMPDDQEKASYYIKEFIHLHMSGSFHDYVTLQLEKEVILSLIFEEESADAVLDALHQIKGMLGADKEYCSITLAFRPVRRHPEELAAAYEESREMIARRMLNRETQLITDLAPDRRTFWLSVSQEQELLAALQGGHADRATDQIHRFLDYMEKNKANAQQFAEFGKEVVLKVMQTLTSFKLDIGPLFNGHHPSILMEECVTLDEYKLCFQQFINGAMQPVQDRNAEKDPIKDYVLDYLSKRYGEDISLEQLADQLQLSRGYLSAYFHEKTGKKFIDYLNEVRISRAKEILSQTDMLIQEIALQVGYQNVNSFIRMFKRISGFTPGEYRRDALARACAVQAPADMELGRDFK